MARRNKTIVDHTDSITLEAFHDGLSDTFDNMYRDSIPTVDELLVRPREAMRFADAIRSRFGDFDLPDDLILRGLLRVRKGG
jgi:hypothetical protein